MVGSFLNVCIYRLPRDRSVVVPPSHCPQCGARLEARDLIPIVSFLALGRKCRRCGGLISWRYALVELLTGVVFAVAILAYPLEKSWYVLPVWIFAAVLLAVIFTDLDHMIIPDGLVWAGVAAAVLGEGVLVANGQQSWWSVQVPGTALALPRVVAGGMLGPVVFYLMRGFSQLLFRREGMGLGDVKLAGAIGAMLGPGLALLSFGLAVVAGAVLGILLLALRLRRRMEYLPFGPFMAVAALVVLLAPEGAMEVATGLYQQWQRAAGLG